MAGIRAADLTSTIVEGVSKALAKILLPKVRKMIREEIDRGMKDIMLEVIKSQGAGRVIEASPQQSADPAASTQTAKEGITKRQARARDRARQIVERNGMTNDPLMDMVINADDRQEEEDLKMEHQLALPMVESKDISAGTQIVDPSQIDFSDRLEKLGINE